jgi:hypothetical protein
MTAHREGDPCIGARPREAKKQDKAALPLWQPAFTASARRVSADWSPKQSKSANPWTPRFRASSSYQHGYWGFLARPKRFELLTPRFVEWFA